MKEQYKVVPECSNYFVSNLGNVKNKKGKLLKLNPDQDGYYRFTGYRDGEERSRLRQVRLNVHKLVGQIFNGFEKGETIHHIDGNKTNNKNTNLQVLPHDYHSFIENRKLSDEQVRMIFTLYVNCFKSVGFLESIGYTKKQIYKALNRNSYLFVDIPIMQCLKAKQILKERRRLGKGCTDDKIKSYIDSLYGTQSSKEIQAAKG